jgi:hypothetical protein
MIILLTASPPPPPTPMTAILDLRSVMLGGVVTIVGFMEADLLAKV